jgi:uncharacterized glyoxalase superfamily protein PhnB
VANGQHSHEERHADPELQVAIPPQLAPDIDARKLGVEDTASRQRSGMERQPDRPRPGGDRPGGSAWPREVGRGGSVEWTGHNLRPGMQRNRSIPQSTVVPVLIYPDVREAVDWLGSAFGFVERVRIGENHRSQLSFGEGAVIVGDVRGERRPPRSGEVTHSVLVRVDDANAHCERAKAHGARILMDPTDFEYGERQYTAEDPAGHQWTFSETLADVAPEEWGGTYVAPE